MLPLKVSLFLVIFCTHGASVRETGKKKDDNPIDKIASVAGFDPSKFAGKWYLLSVASECDYLKTNNHRVEATTIQATQSKNWRDEDILAISTHRKLDGICWEIKHEYKMDTKVKGRFSFKVGGYGGDAQVVVAATDYQNYAILYYQRRKKITIKLYGRKPSASDDVSQILDDRVTKQGFDLEYIYWFPTYGFCETADQFHILNEVPR
ncbi:complement component C8 gamma chain [Pseudophryne corroboree]|uniref:complement component C8 gamma chain n=1 Tax=Pseudophryne corroboree TaxID=495146 RepID=UPI003081CAF7